MCVFVCLCVGMRCCDIDVDVDDGVEGIDSKFFITVFGSFISSTEERFCC